MRHSYTKLKMYMECPAKKRYRYDEKIPSPKSPSAQRGTDYHAVIESAVGAAEPTRLPPELEFYDGYIGRLRSLGAKAEYKFAFNRDWKPVDWTDDTAWIIGVADIWLDSKPVAHVQDWKTGKIYDDHYMQGEFYSTALFGSVTEETYEIKATFVYTDLHKEQNRTYHRDQLPELRDRWATRVERMERDDACVPTPYLGCRWCPYSSRKGGPCRF